MHPIVRHLGYLPLRSRHPHNTHAEFRSELVRQVVGQSVTRRMAPFPQTGQICIGVVHDAPTVPISGPSPLTTRTMSRRSLPASSSIDASPRPASAARLLEARGRGLDLDWLKLPPAEGFAALAVLPSEAKQRLFARCIALCLKPQLAIEDGADPVIEAAGRRLAIAFADYWRPTAANYWSRVKKAHGLAIGREILGDRWARDHAGDKKPELAAALETAFDPAKSTAYIGLDRAAREAAAVWLPPGIAYANATANNTSADPQCDEAASLVADPDAVEPAEIDLPAAELPTFLTEDEPEVITINGASAP